MGPHRWHMEERRASSVERRASTSLATKSGDRQPSACPTHRFRESILFHTRRAWGRMTTPSSLRQTRVGSSPSQEPVEVVCTTILQLFWGFLRRFVADPRFFRGILYDLVSEGVLLP